MRSKEARDFGRGLFYSYATNPTGANRAATNGSSQRQGEENYETNPNLVYAITAVQAGHRLAAKGISVVHSGHGLVVGAATGAGL
jgi:hypothetical protein